MQTWKFWYTDGSKSPNLTSFGIVDNNLLEIEFGLLNPICSIYTAEAVAILKALEYASNRNGKHIICTDSLSTLKSVLNISNNNNIPSLIRTKLIQFPNKLKLMWVPGHVGIQGNDAADVLAKSVATRPTHISNIIETKDIKRALTAMSHEEYVNNWISYSHQYKTINPLGSKAIYPKKITISKLASTIRLRLGHCLVPHGHILNGSSQTNCIFCNIHDNTVKHILDECPIFSASRRRFFGDTPPSMHLMDMNDKSILNMYNFLKITNILKFI